MKYIKTYETNFINSLEDEEYDYQIGDMIVCVDDFDSIGLVNGEIYEVEDFDGKYLSLKKPSTSYYKSRFIPEIEYNRQKYNL